MSQPDVQTLSYPATQSAQATQIHQSALVMLAHLHLERQITPTGIEYVRPYEDLTGRQVDIPKLRQGGVNCIWLSEGGPGEVTVDPEPKARSTVEPNTRPSTRTVFRGASEVQRILRGFDATRRLCQSYPNDLELATSAQQIRDIAARGKIVVLLHTEALLIADDLAMLRSYHALGLRVSGLVHAAPLDWIDCDREQRLGGLTDLGRQIVCEMNALGIVIDISQLRRMRSVRCWRKASSRLWLPMPTSNTSRPSCVISAMKLRARLPTGVASLASTAHPHLSILIAYTNAVAAAVHYMAHNGWI